MDKQYISGTKDTDKLIFSNVNIPDIINLIDAGTDINLIAEVLPKIMAKYNKYDEKYQRNIDQLAYDLVDRGNYDLVKIIFANDMESVSRIIIEYIEERADLAFAEELIKIIPNYYDWTLFDLSGAFDDRDNFEEIKGRLLTYLIVAFATNSLPLLNVIITTYDREIYPKFDEKLKYLDEMKRARLKVNIYRVIKSWDNVRVIYDNNTVIMMDDIVNNIESFNKNL